MKNKIKAHLKAIGVILAIVGAALIISLIPSKAILTSVLLAPIAFMYWLVYETFLHNKKW
jgi:uncharacterized membrane protein YkgB